MVAQANAKFAPAIFIQRRFYPTHIDPKADLSKADRQSLLHPRLDGEQHPQRKHRLSDAAGHGPASLKMSQSKRTFTRRFAGSGDDRRNSRFFTSLGGALIAILPLTLCGYFGASSRSTPAQPPTALSYTAATAVYTQLMLRAGLTVRDYGWFADTTCYNAAACETQLVHDPFKETLGSSSDLLAKFTEAFFEDFWQGKPRRIGRYLPPLSSA